ncbi:MAG TPA: hypothetical protein VGK54_16330 [Chloroflexota bacterium]
MGQAQIRSHHKLLPIDWPGYEIGTYEAKDIENEYARAGAVRE